LSERAANTRVFGLTDPLSNENVEGMSVTDRTRQLADQHQSDFARDGFVVVRGMFSADEMAEIARWTDEVEAYPEIPGKYMKYFEKSLKGSSERLLNRLENFYPYHDDKINFKMPGGDGFKPHQDQQAGWSTYADCFITALVSIDAATKENGCLEMVAGYHQKGLVGEEWEPLTDEQVAAMSPVACPTEPGDVVFFDSYAPHGSGPNLSDSKRRVLYVTYNRSSDGNHRDQYYADKRKSYPPDVERDPGKQYQYRV
jgi:uncharacterized protein YukE